jgi:hypothetical protein
MTPYVFQRGETIILALDAVEGDTGAVSAIAVKLKRVPPGRTSPPLYEPVAADFTIVPRAANGEVPAGWTLTIDAVTSSGLAPGAYMADAALSVGAAVIVTDPVAVRIRESVSG